jgi:hypothetical protein
VSTFSWDLSARTATLSVTSAVNQDVTLISRRGMTSVTTSATVASSPLGTHARKVTLAAGQRTDITVSLLSGWFRLVNRRSGKALDVSGASTADGGKIIQYTSSSAANQQWRFLPNADGSFRLAARHSGKVLDSPGGSAQGTQLVQWQDTGGDDQRWKLVDAGGAYYRLVNVGNGWCADVADGSTADNARVIQWPPVPAPTSSGSSTPCDGTVRCGIPRPHRGPSHALGPGAEGVLGSDLGARIGSRVPSSTALRAAPVTCRPVVHRNNHPAGLVSV